jgi:hypothetical protein
MAAKRAALGRGNPYLLRAGSSAALPGHVPFEDSFEEIGMALEAGGCRT